MDHENFHKRQKSIVLNQVKLDGHMGDG